MPSILLADDDDKVREVVRMLLEDDGFTVTEASDGNEAMRAFRAQPADLLICDLFMPGTDGIQVIPTLHREYPNVKIIAISGGGFHGSIDMLPVAKILGADEIFSKPVNPGRLRVTVRNLLGLSSAEGRAVRPD